MVILILTKWPTTSVRIICEDDSHLGRDYRLATKCCGSFRSILCSMFRPCGQALASGSYNKIVRLWDLGPSIVVVSGCQMQETAILVPNVVLEDAGLQPAVKIST